MIDGNGRIKLPNRFIDAFLERSSDGEIMLYCLPEGALAIYPTATFDAIRQEAEQDLTGVGSSMLRRREFRRFGALSQPDLITRQGRITLPASFRAMTELAEQREAMIVGTEIGAEIWNCARWQAELATITAHENARGAMELEQDMPSAAPSDGLRQ